MSSTAAELMAEAMAIRPGKSPAGRPLSLSAALGTSSGRRQEEVVHAYWRLVESLCRVHFALDSQDDMAQIKSRPDEQLLLVTAQRGAQAAVREAELAAFRAQYELASLLSLAPDAILPLPSDRPHVGAYRTNFQELFSSRPAPLRARWIEQVLPLRLKAIEVRKSAVEAAQESAAGSQRDYASGKADLARVLETVRELRQQREAFVATVCRYNHDIADYAQLAIGLYPAAPPLVSMLISTPADAGQGAVVAESQTPPSGRELPVPGRPTPAKAPPNRLQTPKSVTTVPVTTPGVTPVSPATPSARSPAPATKPVEKSKKSPTSGVQPQVAPVQQPAGEKAAKGPATDSKNSEVPPAVAPTNGVPSPSPPSLVPQFSTPPRPQLRDGGSHGSTLAPIPAQGFSPGVSSAGSPSAWYASPFPTTKAPRPVVSDPYVVPAAGVAPAGARQPAEVPVIEVAPAASQSGAGQPSPSQQDDVAPAFRVARRPTATTRATEGPAGQLCYPGLDGVSAEVQVRNLIAALYGGQGLPANIGEPITLEDCLRGRSAQEQSAVRSLYWTARRHEAEYQALSRQAELLRGLASLPSLKGQPTNPAIRAATLKTEAALLESQAALVESLAELAARIGRESNSRWPLPSTLPHGPTESAAALGNSLSTKRLAAESALLRQSLLEHAAAVVQADAARAAQRAALENGRQTIAASVSAVIRQTELTFAFLHTLTEYNQLADSSEMAARSAPRPGTHP